MTKTDSLDQLKERIERLRNRTDVKHPEVEAIAQKVGRVFEGGTEPIWKRKGWYRLSIPRHPKALKVGTLNSILDQLLEDVERLEDEQQQETNPTGPEERGRKKRGEPKEQSGRRPPKRRAPGDFH